MESKGIFITFEGPDGSGKTTISQQVYEKLQTKFFNSDKIIYTREPGGTDIAEKIRDIIVNYDIDPRTEALLFAASRSEHIWKKIMKAKNERKIILCDRFVHSSLVYQGIVKGLGIKKIYKINEFAMGQIRPDYIFYFDAMPKTCLERLNQRKRYKDRMDFQSEDEIRKTINGYYSILKFDEKKIFRINAEKNISEIIDDVYHKILKIIEGI